MDQLKINRCARIGHMNAMINSIGSRKTSRDV